VRNTKPDLIKSLLDVLESIGICLQIKDGDISVSSKQMLNPIDVETLPYPGFPTDLQAQLMVLLTQINGISHIKESIFNNRFNHANELNKMGADIVLNSDIARIKGNTKLKGNDNVFATDLRASAALVLGALVADGKTIIKNASQLFRGYEDLPGKLSRLGAEIKVIK
jgi:UDP-N-acetylglucosamine 1-carboxyvinyltransferase